MHYYSYDYPSVITEERLANAVCASVKDYLGEVSDYVAHCQAQALEQQEIIDTLTAEKRALQQQVDELKQCLATCHAMSSKAMTFGGAVGTVVAHADHVTLQYKAS